MLADIQPTTWTVSDISASAKGAKTAQINANGSPPQVRFATPEEPLHAVFEPSSYDPAQTRHNVDLNVPPYLEDFMGRADAWAMALLLKESPRFFKRQVSKEELHLMYQSCLKKHSKDDKIYPDTVRCKINTTGPKQLRVWSFAHESRAPPEAYRHCDLVPMVTFKNLWFSANTCGIVLEIADMMVREQTTSCPF